MLSFELCNTFINYFSIKKCFFYAHKKNSIADRYKSSRNYTQHINDGLKRLIDRAPFNELSTNWARHTYATLAFNELDASRDDVSAALGHKYGSEITAVYINPDIRKVDELNRRMLDLVFSDN